MAVTSTAAFAGPFTPDGVGTSFPFAFAAMDASEIQVVRRTTGGIDTVVGGYTVSFNADHTGTVKFSAAPSAGDPLWILPSPSFQQQTRFVSQGAYSPKSVDDAFDRGSVRDIYLKDGLGRSIRAPIGEPLAALPNVAARANKSLVFDALGNPQAGAGIPDIVVTAAAGATANSRSAMAAIGSPAAGQSALLAEVGRDGTFVFDSANHSAHVTNDPNQGIYIAPATDTTGASGAWVRHPGIDTWINPKWFGAKFDTVLSATPNGVSSASISSGTDDTAALQAALNYINYIGGGTLSCPAGSAKLSSYLTIYKNTTVIGAGRRATFLVQSIDGATGSNAGQTLRNGSVFYSNWSSNTTTNVQIKISGIGFHCNSATSNGAAFYDNGGANIVLEDFSVSGFKYGVVFDQTELSHITKGTFTLQANSGAAIWFVNGSQLTPGNSATYTNVLTVSRCQINEGSGIYGILDEGGTAHSFDDNNYNAGLNQIYACGVTALKITGGDFEGSAGDSIKLATLKASDGSGSGGSTGVEINGVNIKTPASNACINILGGQGIHVGSSYLNAVGGGYPIIGGANANGLSITGVTSGRSDGEVVDSFNGGNFADTKIDKAIRTVAASAFNLDHTYFNKSTRCTNATSTTVTLLQDSALAPNAVRIGASAWLEQTIANAPVSFVAGSGVTISTGPTATTAQYQKLKVMKTGANTYQTELVLQNPLTPVSLTVGGGTALTKAVVYTPTLTPASVAAQTVAEQTFTVTGLTTADKVIVNPPAIGNSTGIAGVRVSAADTLAIRFNNPTAGALTPSSGTYAVLAFRS